MKIKKITCFLLSILTLFFCAVPVYADSFELTDADIAVLEQCGVEFGRDEFVFDRDDFVCKYYDMDYVWDFAHTDTIEETLAYRKSKECQIESRAIEYFFVKYSEKINDEIHATYCYSSINNAVVKSTDFRQVQFFSDYLHTGEDMIKEAGYTFETEKIYLITGGDYCKYLIYYVTSIGNFVLTKNPENLELVCIPDSVFREACKKEVEYWLAHPYGNDGTGLSADFSAYEAESLKANPSVLLASPAATTSNAADANPDQTDTVSDLPEQQNSDSGKSDDPKSITFDVPADTEAGIPEIGKSGTVEDDPDIHTQEPQSKLFIRIIGGAGAAVVIAAALFLILRQKKKQ